MTAVQGDLLAQEALDRVERNADPDWIAAAKRATWQLIKAGEVFSSDDIWRLLEEWNAGRPHEPRALGAVLRAASKAGYIEATGSYFRSERPENHSRPVCLWVPRKVAA